MTMTAKDLGLALVDACRTGQEAQLLTDHYAPDAVSVEAFDFSGQGRETHGIEGIRGKHAWWAATFDVTAAEVTGPFVHGDDRFSVTFQVETIEKATGKTDKMSEIAVYHVADGKIVREEFFYAV